MLVFKLLPMKRMFNRLNNNLLKLHRNSSKYFVCNKKVVIERFLC